MVAEKKKEANPRKAKWLGNERCRCGAGTAQKALARYADHHHEPRLHALRPCRMTGQTFKDLQIGQSFAMKEIVSEAQNGVEQPLGKLSAQNSRVFQGQMETASFACMFG